MGSPEPPQFVTDSIPSFLAWSRRRIIAGSTCETFSEKLSPGPYRLVGIAEIQGNPNCLRTAWTWMIPAILAIAYASLVGSRWPFSN